MYKSLTRDAQDPKKIKDTVSLYQPQYPRALEVTLQVLQDYQHGKEVQQKPRSEFNDRSLLSEIDINQKAFNSYVEPRSEDPDESWRAQTVRPITRNKLISIAAHVTSTVLFPNVFAQNDADEEDRGASEVMRSLVEWVIDNSNYSRAFIQAVISALVDPAVIMEAGYVEVMRTVKRKMDEKDEFGYQKYKKEEIIDEVLSGFLANVVPCQEILIANIKEPNIQKQRFIIRSQYIDYKEAKQIYGKYENFAFVKPGVYTVFDEGTRTFYDVHDEDSRNYLVNRVIYYSRIDDLELVFINGILMCHPDRPLSREDKLYPFAKSGYEPLNNGQFFYYKSAANKLGSDQDLVDTLYNMIIDGTFMALMPPMALYGSEDINSSVSIPGSITSFRDPNTKMESLAPKSDIRAGLETIGMVERSIAQSSQDDIRSGNAQSGERTAREVILMEQNARIALGLFGKMIGFLVEDFGKLMIGDILQHMSVAQVDALSGSLNYRSFLLPDQVIDGKRVTKKIEFTDEYLDKPEMTEGGLNELSFDLLEEEGGLEGSKKIYKVNPPIFRNLKYKIRVDIDQLTPKSKALEKALNLEFYDRAIQNPLVDQEAITREMFETYKPGESSKFIKKQEAMAPTVPPPKGVNSNLPGQLTGSNSLGVAASSDL